MNKHGDETSQSTEGSRRFKPQPHVVTVAHGDDLVLLDALAGRYYTLNATGRQVWDDFNDGNSLATIIDKVSSQYGLSPADATHDVARLTEALLRAALVTAQ